LGFSEDQNLASLKPLDGHLAGPSTILPAHSYKGPVPDHLDPADVACVGRSINEIAAAQFHPITNFECPLWVISRYLRCKKSCPVYPSIATEGVNVGFGQKLPLSRE
jgi:hypothetical protein